MPLLFLNIAWRCRYNDVIMSVILSQTTGVSMVYWTVCSGADQRKHHSSASLALTRGNHRWPVNSPHKDPVTRKMFSFDDFIMVVPSKPLPLFPYTISAESSSFGLSSTTSNEIWIEMLEYCFKEVHLKLSYVKWLLFCSSVNVLTPEVPWGFASCFNVVIRL